MENYNQERNRHMDTLDVLSDQERYNRAFAIADRLVLEGGYDPSENPALLAEAVSAEDQAIGYNHALTVVLSL